MILGRPFFATSNVVVNCRNGVMKLAFGNMIMDLNAFNLGKTLADDEEMQEVNWINTVVGDHMELICHSNFGDEEFVKEEGLKTV